MNELVLFSREGVGDIVVFSAEDGIRVLQLRKLDFDASVVRRVANNDELDVSVCSESTFPHERGALRSLRIALTVSKGGNDNIGSRIVEPDDHLCILALIAL